MLKLWHSPGVNSDLQWMWKATISLYKFKVCPCIRVPLFVVKPRHRLCKKSWCDCVRSTSQLPEALLGHRHSNRLIELVLYRLTGHNDLERDAESWEREKETDLQRSDRVVRWCNDVNSARESEGCVDMRRETYYRINKWLQLLTQRRKRDQERESPDLIDFPPGTRVLWGKEAEEEMEREK